MTLLVNGVDEDNKVIELKEWGTQIIVFQVSENNPGLYNIKVGALSNTLRVTLSNPGSYPKLANYYCGKTSINTSEASLLSRWDLVVVRDEAISNSKESLKLIRKINPNIKILAWVSAGLDRSIKYFENADESWYLHYADNPSNPKLPQGRRIELWTTTTGSITGLGMNPDSDWASSLANYVRDKLMSSGLIDGVFYDYLGETVAKRNVDINNDGKADSPSVVNREYSEGMTNLLSLTRELLGPNAIIMGNPGVEWSASSPYWAYANGQMQENALGTEFGSSWPEIWDIYQKNMQMPSPPARMHWIAADTNDETYDAIKPDLPSAELQKMRFGLAIALLGDGYFGFDQGAHGGHKELWWFPEYDADLGQPKGTPQQRSDGSWIREFDNGVVLANPTYSTCTIEFATLYQDISTGSVGTSFTVQAQDGRIFVPSR